MDSHDTSEGAICESIRDSVNVLYEIIVPIYLTLPTKEQAQKEAELFYGDGDFIPNVFMRYLL